MAPGCYRVKQQQQQQKILDGYVWGQWHELCKRHMFLTSYLIWMCIINIKAMLFTLQWQFIPKTVFHFPVHLHTTLITDLFKKKRETGGWAIHSHPCLQCPWCMLCALFSFFFPFFFPIIPTISWFKVSSTVSLLYWEPYGSAGKQKTPMMCFHNSPCHIKQIQSFFPGSHCVLYNTRE